MQLALLIISSIIVLVNSQQDLCNQEACMCSDGFTKIDCVSKFGNLSVLEIKSEQNILKADFRSNFITDLIINTDIRLQILYLNNNKLKSLSYEHEFEHLTSLIELDVSNNQIETIDEHAFDHLHRLSYLNLGNSGSFRLTNHLCPLTSLKRLDLSSLDLVQLQLNCWANNTQNQVIQIFIEELYLKNSKNVFEKWSNWFQYIGKSLKVLDLTNTNLFAFDATIWSHTSLAELIVSNNQNLNKTQLYEVLVSPNVAPNLTRIDMAQVNASNDNFNLKNFLQEKPNRLTYLDISSNFYIDYDIASVMINISTKLQTFIASSNQFISSMEFNQKLEFNSKLEVLNLSKNKLNSTFLYHIKPISTLRVLDLSNNEISVLFNDLIADKLVSLFSNMPNITDINLSYNHLIQFVTYFHEDSTQINRFDLSHNSLDKFYILSLKTVDDSTFPYNLIPLGSSDKDFDDIDIEENTMDGAVVDSSRYINMNLLDISSNRFTELNFKKQFKSIKSLNRLDASFNPVLKTITSLTYNALHVINIVNNNKQQQQNIIEWNQLVNENNNKFFCINELEFEHCQINTIPSLEYTCIKKISLANNQLKSKIFVKTSKFSLNFLKYLDLMNNNITSISLAIEDNREVLIDKYKRNTNETFIDLKMNKYYECDCQSLKNIETEENIEILTDCVFDDSCTSLNNLNGNGDSNFFGTLRNRRFVFLIAIICSIIAVLAILIIYSLLSDIRNLNCATLSSVILCCKLKLASSNGDGDSGSGSRPRVPYVRLSRPSEEENNLEIEGF